MTVANTESNIPAINPGDLREWELLNENAMQVEGYSLYGGKENDRKLDELIDVPFTIKHVSFRPGDIIPEGQKAPRDYVSVELLVSPYHAHKFPRKYVVFNDGSTGIYRQIVAALVVRGLVTVDDNLPEEGSANTTRYDVSFASDDTGVGFDLPLNCPEGLRASDYDNPDGSKGRTWYLA